MKTVFLGLLALLLLILSQTYGVKGADNVSYSQFRQWVIDGQVTECSIGSEFIRGTALVGGSERRFETSRVEDAGLVDLLDKNQVRYATAVENTWFTTLMSWILPAIACIGFFGVFWFIFGRMRGR